MGLFGTKKATTLVVIDIGSSTLGGAYVSIPTNGEPPVVLYSVRIPAHAAGEERSMPTLLRALELLITTLMERGAPAFARSGQDAHPDRVIISVGSPWQDTKVETDVIDTGKPFVFTKNMLRDAVAKRQDAGEGKKFLQRELITTLLNGYAVTQPAGKRVLRAEIIMLVSSIDTLLMTALGKAAKSLSPREGALIVPFQSLAYEVLLEQYPHDRDFLLMRVSGEATSLLFASRGLVMDSVQVTVGLDSLSGLMSHDLKKLPVNGEEVAAQTAPIDADAERKWVEGVTGCFKEFATRHALPRILFLVADERAMAPLKRLIDTPQLHGLWLSDEPLTVIPIVSRMLASLIQHQGEAESDVMLDLIVLYAQVELAPKKAK